ncbi:RimK family alpha-L-glutamate ligase [Streptomyces sp. NPDC101118]|uniref:ATP-grasp domain-containing protein n=1 Tax=Streptomyces sp. NPDC101118 TaxID=3366109 RepID=UPI0038229AF9
MILCVGVAADPTFLAGLHAVRAAGLDHAAVDLASLALRGSVRVPLDDLAGATVDTGRRFIRAGEAAAVWCRLLDVSAHAPDAGSGRAAAGHYQAFLRLFEHLPVRVMNRPLREATGFTKVLHAVTLAAVGGWPVPRTCLTSDPDEARAFVAGCAAGAVFKGASAVKTFAQVYEACHEERLDRLARVPVLFQERIVGPDVRVHTVGDEAFGEAIHSPVLDYRTVAGVNDYRPITLPESVLGGCARLTAHTGVPLLGVDFKVDRATGEWYFLEANAMPCFEGYDRRAGGAITRAMARWLGSRGG